MSEAGWHVGWHLRGWPVRSGNLLMPRAGSFNFSRVSVWLGDWVGRCGRAAEGSLLECEAESVRRATLGYSLRRLGLGLLRVCLPLLGGTGGFLVKMYG